MDATSAAVKRLVFYAFLFSPILLILLLFGGCGGGDSRSAEWRPEYGVFVWDASPLLNPATRGDELDLLRERDVARLLVSFTPAQIRSIRKASDDLNALADAARDRKMELELLLGDPAWILPEHRGELVELVDFFEAYPFGGIHLDLEPDQLISRDRSRARLLDDLEETLAEVRKRTERPLSLICHRRYVEEGEFDRSAEYAALVDEIVVMVYSTKTDEVARRFQKICDASRGRDVKFSLAQSVENISSMIARGESYFDCGLEDFHRTMEHLTSLVVDAPNAGDLIVQAWADYRKMK